MKFSRFGLTFTAVCALTTSSGAQDTASTKALEDLRREVRTLEEKLRVLSAAANEVAELTFRSATLWSRALAGDSIAGIETTGKGNSRTKAAVAKRARADMRSAHDVGTVRGKVILPKGEPIAYAYVENVFAPPARGKTVVIDQKDKNFAPSWAVIRRGTTIEFPNHDNIYHNVFSHASGNSFDLGLYNSGGPAKSHSFKSAGSVDIYCNIHPSMAASVLVVPNDLFAKVLPDGSFVINSVPSGQRKVVAWSPGTALATQWVELKTGDTADVELTLELKSRVHDNKAGRPYGSYE
jgi:plastocyanin